MTNLEEFLLSRGIELAYPGHKNISNKCEFGICCPYCSDKNFHLGIFLNNTGFSCFRCKTKGSLFRLLHDLFEISFPQYKELVDLPIIPETSTSEYLRKKIEKRKPNHITESLPVLFPPNAFYGTKREHRIALKLTEHFLSTRKNPISIKNLKRYGCYPCLRGLYKRRLIMPIKDIRGIERTFQARDLTNRAMVPYRNPGDIEIKNYLYGIDEIYKSSAILVEGIFDKWRTGDDSTGTFGVGLSSYQIELLLKKKIKFLIFAWDYDAYPISVKTAREVQPFFDKIKVLDFPFEQDPDLFGRKGVYNLINQTKVFGSLV